MLLWYYDFPNFPGGGPPDPLNERGEPPLILSPLAASAHIIPSTFYAPPVLGYSGSGPANVYHISNKHFHSNKHPCHLFRKKYYIDLHIVHQGPVVQSIVSLTSLLSGRMIKCFTTSLPNTLIFFVEKMREAFALQKPSHIFSTKNIGKFQILTFEILRNIN